MLPKKVTKEIETLCRIFLWTGKANPSRKALVAWERICLPKQAGGWNVVDIKLWNKAATIKLLWNLARKTDSMWVRWVHVYYFKKLAADVATIPKSSTWNLKKIMGYRDLVRSAGGWSSFEHRGRFSIKLMYDHLRPQAPHVSWSRIVCNNKGSPKSIFITWLALNDRLYTKDRMRKWQLNCCPQCVFCHTQLETVHHLFFQCSYSKMIWQGLLAVLGHHRQPQQWNEEVEWIQKKSRKTSPLAKLTTMCFSECVYSIWLQRNAQVFNANHLPCNQVIKDILFRVSCRASDSMRAILIKY